jgi:predicted dehydrogenase
LTDSVSILGMKEPRILICGFGFMGEMHAQAYRGIPPARLVGIVDVATEKAKRKAEKLGLGVPLFGTLAEALAATGADVVDICLPTDAHAAAAIEAFRAGRHVFCEKPMARNVTDAEKMIQERRKAGTFCQVGHCIRFWPEYQAFERFFRKEAAGRLRSLTLQRRASRPTGSSENWLGDPVRSGGAALDLHIHDTDYVLHLFGIPSEVLSRGTRDAGGWSHISTHYLYPDLLVHAEGGWDYPPEWGFQMAFQAVFDRGAVEFDSRATPSLRVTLEGKATEPLAFEAAAGAAETTGNISSLGGYANELKYFIGRLVAGKAPELATLEQSRDSLAVVLAEMTSAEEGRVVALPRDFS